MLGTSDLDPYGNTLALKGATIQRTRSNCLLLFPKSRFIYLYQLHRGSIKPFYLHLIVINISTFKLSLAKFSREPTSSSKTAFELPLKQTSSQTELPKLNTSWMLHQHNYVATTSFAV
ncbi:Hypothetical_protein [Hexamita inflata]|uniref:Hypothetical_protein n=1 Tax=Hexamita inflata TaxID=28002 RepID=A0AA86U8K7_9EUKA|nr:Hypothetical protein HINF_LOCUS33149 [Hexamita inflata]